MLGAVEVQAVELIFDLNSRIASTREIAIANPGLGWPVDKIVESRELLKQALALAGEAVPVAVYLGEARC